MLCMADEIRGIYFACHCHDSCFDASYLFIEVTMKSLGIAYPCCHTSKKNHASGSQYFVVSNTQKE